MFMHNDDVNTENYRRNDLTKMKTIFRALEDKARQFFPNPHFISNDGCVFLKQLIINLQTYNQWR